MKLSVFFKTQVLAIALIAGISSCTSPGGRKVAQGPREYIVEIAQMQFNPAKITVHAGDKVTFVNHDMVTHDVTEDPGKTWSSSQLPVNKSWSMTVSASSDYYCSLHPVMKGKIIVEQ